MTFSNGLSDSELERLALLAEECGEVIQAVNKIIRHGYESYNPFDKDRVANRRNLEKEIGDVQFAINLMSVEQDIDSRMTHHFAVAKAETIRPYLHHQ